MINARFRIELPETVWIAEVSDEFPRATFRLLSGYRTDDTALELGEVTAERPADVVEAIRSHPSIDDCDRLQSEDGRALTKYETSDTDLYEFVELSSLTIEFPVDVRNGWFEFDLTGTREELDRLQEVLDSASLSYELLSLVGSAESEGPLTDRQREVLEAAVREGYFDVPRECLLEELADDLGVDTSTASVVIRRGESRLVKWHLTGSANGRLE
ncbi:MULTISPECIES: helix-turn-helix domain-containing protein [Natrialba]|uniref:Bacterio-opsin activator n=1 Tax=Natrialba swarupiae TaxID=2448032 RepID=A0A5D5AN63_9EURY|nr:MULTISPECIES: helix-turn-helix domain-containing protein [Natrialba]MWV39413.1 bacterio-opsin activator [Natrialba sp. INN-245]TYT63106.1 bacterio-opsin activator [Natrialba swarupiae]